MRSLIRERLRNCSTNTVHQVYRQIFSLFVTWILFLTPYQIQVYVIWALRVGLNFFFFFLQLLHVHISSVQRWTAPLTSSIFLWMSSSFIWDGTVCNKMKPDSFTEREERHLNQDFTWFHITVYDTNSYIKKIDNNLKIFHNIVLKV